MSLSAAGTALIVTADDFGLHESINEAVEQGSRDGILTAASLMVGAPATLDAVRRAKSLVNLRVGLHVVLADGAATLASREIPAIVDSNGRFGDRMALNGVRAFLLPWVRRQFEAEIRAQFAAFARFGLALDHVNVHKHFQLHPTLSRILLRVGRDYGMKAMRLPNEPLWCASRSPGRLSVAGAMLLRPWIRLLRKRLRAAGIAHNDWVFGLASSGMVDEATLLELIARLPAGVSEIYLHPAVPAAGPITSSMPHYRHADELAALCSLRVRAAIEHAPVVLGGFGDVCATRARSICPPSAGVCG